MRECKPLGEGVHPHKSINAKNLLSPIPLLRLKKTLVIMKSEEILQIDCTDPGAGEDISSWCSRMKHDYLGEITHSEYSSYFIMKR